MTSLSSSLLSIGILLSGILSIALMMKAMIKYREHTVKLPVDRDQLQRIPAFGLLPLHFKDGRLCFLSWCSFRSTAPITRQAILAGLPFSHWLATLRAVTNKEPTNQIKALFSLVCSRAPRISSWLNPCHLAGLKQSVSSRLMRLCIKWRKGVWGRAWQGNDDGE